MTTQKEPRTYRRSGIYRRTLLGAMGSMLLAVVADGAAGEPMDKAANATNKFGLDLYDQVRNEQGNLFLSPVSLSTALTMTYAGARGETAQQMAQVLHLPSASRAVHPQFSALIACLNRSPQNVLTIANALWGQQGFQFRDDYLALNREYYSAGLNVVNFREAPDPARKTINTWVARKTNEKIPKLLPPGSITARTRLVLTNAVYFKGKWNNAFDAKKTEPAPFNAAKGRTVTVPMMVQKTSFGYAETDALQILDMPYAGDELSMTILLPKEPGMLDRLERMLDWNNLQAWLRKLNRREVRAYIPRFKTTRSFSLARILAGMGMPLAFSGDADFSRMTEDQPLQISDVVHKAYVRVDEHGTEAAAATGVVMRATAAPSKPVVFRADHPFLFFIRHRSTGTILFMGRLADPA